jgi:DNA invertase Pin-like site-specific DNA recombinase
MQQDAQMSNNTANIIAYYRVSTQQQGKSGLGLDAQRAAVQRFADSETFTIAQEFIEIETGKGADALDKVRFYSRKLPLILLKVLDRPLAM